ncbi:arylsulfatase [Luteipulveratus mongoliensis]|uniref:Arylsulfatase n=1 Tax=Luteipulveratus mongoliensis TaxID=571913 RepID=A0A0K1JGK8_9MICO|nr:arylsulfatase [Luteipulveratus mongoliensis]AKU15857.1 arylsulfatase [Luteipulveratus mongoliensis]
MTQPNVVLICVDEWRGDCLSAAGHPAVQTPYLDDLAAGGTLFSRAYSATPTCVPARVALFTGQSQEVHGRVGYTEGVPFEQAHPVTVQGEFRKAGYQTQAIGKMHVWPERSRTGFDDVRLHDGFLHQARSSHRRQFEFFDDYIPWLRRQPGSSPTADYFDHGVNCNSVVARPWDKPEQLHPTSWIGTEATEFLYRRDPTKPFFLYLSFHRPHPPYDPPAWAFDMYMDLPPYEPVVGDWEQHYDAHRRDGAHDAFVGHLDPRVVHRARAGYYGLMTQIDHQVNRFRETLYDFGLADNTVVAFTSDHGEMMGDHHMFRKGFGYEGSANVPLIIGGDTGRAAHADRVVDEVVELRDIMPTLLDLAGIPIPPECDGRSLKPFLDGETVTDWRPYLHGEHVLLGQSLQWVTDGKIKYCWASAEGTEELFDLVADPEERHNLATSADHQDLLHTWRGRLIESLDGREEGYVQGGDLVAGCTPVSILRHTRERIAAEAS